MRGAGRYELVYGRVCKPLQEMHEVLVTEVELLSQIEIAPSPKIGRTRADGVFERDGRLCCIEVDNSANMTRDQMEKKWERYPADVDILIVARTESRMLRLLQSAERVKKQVAGTTFDRLWSGMENPLVTYFGGAAGL